MCGDTWATSRGSAGSCPLQVVRVAGGKAIWGKGLEWGLDQLQGVDGGRSWCLEASGEVCLGVPSPGIRTGAWGQHLRLGCRVTSAP